jgi:hypothetical protein
MEKALDRTVCSARACRKCGAGGNSTKRTASRARLVVVTGFDQLSGCQFRDGSRVTFNFVTNGSRAWKAHGPASHRVFRKKFTLKLRAAGIPPWRRRSGGFVDRKRNTRQA